MNSFQPAKRLILRTLLLIACAIMAMIVPKFGLFINFVGAFACTALAFVMPVWIYNTQHQDEMSRTKRIGHHALLLFGIIVGGIASTVSVYELVQAFAKQDQEEDKEAIIDASKTDVSELDLNGSSSAPGPGVTPVRPGHLLF